MNAAVNAWTLYAQWTAVFGAFWLTWWAARSNDAVALRIVALALVIVPAVLMPVAILVVRHGEGMGTGRFAIVSAAAGIVGLVRGLFLVVWTILSKDTNALRIVGVVAAALLLTGFAAQIAFLSVIASGSS